MSSPQITTMLGFLSAAWAGATTPKSAAPAVSTDAMYPRSVRFMTSPPVHSTTKGTPKHSSASDVAVHVPTDSADATTPTVPSSRWGRSCDLGADATDYPSRERARHGGISKVTFSTSD